MVLQAQGQAVDRERSGRNRKDVNMTDGYNPKPGDKPATCGYQPRPYGSRGPIVFPPPPKRPEFKSPPDHNTCVVCHECMHRQLVRERWTSGASRVWAALELLRWMEQAKIPYPEELWDVVLAILEAEAGLYRGGMTEKTPAPAGASSRGL
jgi:hypothetical protein